MRRHRGLPDWNLVATVRERQFVRACEVLEEFGPVKRSDFFNVLVARVADPAQVLETLRDWWSRYPDLPQVFGRIAPALAAFDFETAKEFEAKAKDIVLGWAPRLAGKSFHVRVHRRGGKEMLSGQAEERVLDAALMAALAAAGTPGRISLYDPDAVVRIETVGPRAGLALWTRDDLARYPFLGAD